MYSIEYINSLTGDNIMNAKEIDTLFDIKKNRAKGDCLFESLSQSLNDGKMDFHENIRKEICNFYKVFDETIDYETDSIEQKLAFSIIGDPTDDDRKLHKENICKSKIYANISDIYIASILYSKNIILFLLSDSKKEYRIMPIINTASNEYIYIRLIGRNHYEAMIPYETIIPKPIISHRSTVKAKSKSKSIEKIHSTSVSSKKSNNKTKSKSPTSFDKKKSKSSIRKNSSLNNSSLNNSSLNVFEYIKKLQTSEIDPILILKSHENTLKYENDLTTEQKKEIKEEIKKLKKKSLKKR